MWKAKCPRCGATFSLRPRNFRQWWTTKRKCPGCGADVEPSNYVLLGGVYGLMCGYLIAASQYLLRSVRETHEWLPFVCAVVLASVVWVPFFCFLAEWRVVDKRIQNLPAVRRWSRLFLVGVVIATTGAIGLIAISMKLWLDILPDLASAETRAGQEITTALARLWVGLAFDKILWVIMGIGVLSATIASVMEKRARRTLEQADNRQALVSGGRL